MAEHPTGKLDFRPTGVVKLKFSLILSRRLIGWGRAG
jgi:hypothetical protein